MLVNLHLSRLQDHYKQVTFNHLAPNNIWYFFDGLQKDGGMSWLESLYGFKHGTTELEIQGLTNHKAFAP